MSKDSLEIPDDAQHIMLVEDDISLAQWISDYLTTHGFLVTIATRGDEAIELIRQDQPAIVILDVMLPVKDGLDVCKAARVFYHKPILMLTARNEETDEVLGLELGADDYLSKPVKPRVLLARVKALLRRNTESLPDKVREFGPLKIDGNAKTATLHGRDLSISTNEFDVLWILAEQAGQTVSRQSLVEQLRGIEYDGFDRSIDILISRLRKKLQNNSEKSSLIKTVWGKGYLFSPNTLHD